ncbi:MAG: metal-dependent transcriptional regulator [Candidatus Gastranaerophilales bacterium]|nr:metal-dependent transcriptional regulator [Candidatus Gastranaerophilales bacterium]
MSIDLSESLENYLEVIYNLSTPNKSARAVDIAKKLNVGKSSVTDAIKILAVKKLVKHAPYSGISLTKKGAEIAKEVDKKHKVLFNFLGKILGVQEAEAIETACKMEHYLSQDAFSKLISFVEFTQSHSCCDKSFLEEFGKFFRAKKGYEKNGDK